MNITEDHGVCIQSFTVTGNTREMSFSMGYYSSDGAIGPDQHANRFFDIVKARLITNIPNEVTMGAVTAYFNSGGPLGIGVSDRTPYTGTLGVGAEPPNTSLLIRKNTGLAGRKYRGRMFLPATRDVDVDAGGNVLAARQTSINTALALVLSDMANAGILGWAMPARLLHTGAELPTPIVSLVCDPRIATQRRRNR